MARTNIDIDDEVLQRVQSTYGLRTKREAVDFALRRLLVEPLHVVARRSTDVVAPEDPEIAAAVRFIHDHAAEGIGVADVVADRLLSRRALEIRFR